MDAKTKGIVATVASVILCGCPGLFICLFGAVTAGGKGTFNNQSLSPTVGFVLLCLSIIFIVIPVVVGFFSLRKKPDAASSSTPIPPAS